MIEGITEKTRELLEKYPKFFGENYKDKVRAKYLKEGDFVPLLKFYSHHLAQYVSLERMAFLEYQTGKPVNYILVASDLSRPIIVDEKTNKTSVFWDVYRGPFVDEEQLPHVRAFMKRLRTAKSDLDKLKKSEDNPLNSVLIDSLDKVDAIYEHVIERVNLGLPVCVQLVCDAIRREGMLFSFKKRDLEYILLNDVVLKNITFSVDKVHNYRGAMSINNAVAAAKNVIKGTKPFDMRGFKAEIRRCIDYSLNTFIPACQESANRFSKFYEAQVVERVNERLKGKGGKNA